MAVSRGVSRSIERYPRHKITFLAPSKADTQLWPSVQGVGKKTVASVFLLLFRPSSWRAPGLNPAVAVLRTGRIFGDGGDRWNRMVVLIEHRWRA